MYIIVFCSKKLFFYRRVTVVVLLLSDQFNLYIFILGKPGTCEKTGRFQCNNGKCIWKHLICDSDDDCGDRVMNRRRMVLFVVCCLIFLWP